MCKCLSLRILLTDKQTDKDNPSVMTDEHLRDHECMKICHESCMNSEEFYSI